jgi:hypothetical protein
MNQYFITKIKDEYLPEIFLEYVREKKIEQYYPIFFIEKQYFYEKFIYHRTINTKTSKNKKLNNIIIYKNKIMEI